MIKKQLQIPWKKQTNKYHNVITCINRPKCNTLICLPKLLFPNLQPKNWNPFMLQRQKLKKFRKENCVCDKWSNQKNSLWRNPRVKANKKAIIITPWM